MAKRIIVAVLKTVILSSLLLGAYYYFFILPKNRVYNALTKIEKSLSQNYYGLLQNRLSYKSITRLKVTTANFDYARGSIIYELQKSNEEGLKTLNDSTIFLEVKGAPSDTLNFYNKDLATVYPSLLNKNRGVYKEQEKIIKRLKSFDEVFSKIFAFDPESDFGSLDIQKDKEQLLEGVSLAKNGISTTKDKVNSLESKNNEVERLVEKLESIQVFLTALENSIQTENLSQYKKYLESFYVKYGDVKSQALIAEQAIIQSEESVKLLTDQTNLIYEYEYWLNKIKSFQEKMGT